MFVLPSKPPGNMKARLHAGLIPRLFQNYDRACFSNAFGFFESLLVARSAFKNLDGACFSYVFWASLRFACARDGKIIEVMM